MKDLVLSVIKNRTWHDLDCYATSLYRSGFAGKRIIFVEDVPDDAQYNLQALGFEVIPFETPAFAKNVHFQTSRYLAARDYLRDYWHEYRFVFWTDVCDLVFQTNPSVWMEQNCGTVNAELIAIKEGWLIKNQPINDIWIQKILIDSEYQRLRQEEVLCSGTIQGTGQAIFVLFDQMCNLFQNVDGMQGIDQGVFNAVVRSSTFKGITRIPEAEEGFVTTCGIFLSPSEPNTWTIAPPVFDRASGLVYTPDGSKLYSIVHQYNRHHGLLDSDGSWRSILERRYRA